MARFYKFSSTIYQINTEVISLDNTILLLMKLIDNNCMGVVFMTECIEC